jgi:hypothetical protein
MLKLVFLCDISGTDEERKDNIKMLHRPIAYFKAIDDRFKDRLENEQLKTKGEFKIIDVIVDGNFEPFESKQIYDKCWKIMNNEDLTYEKAKEIIKSVSPSISSWKEYLEMCDRDSRFYKNPEEVYKGKFENRVDYLGLERKNYVSKDEYKKAFSVEYKNTYNIELSKLCIELEKRHRFPSHDLVVDIYKWNKLEDILDEKYEISLDDFDKFFAV